MICFMDDGYTEALEKHLEKFKGREQRRTEAFDKAFGDIPEYQMHGVGGVARLASETGNNTLMDKIYQINREVK